MSNQDDKKKSKLGGAPQLSDMILGSLKPRVGKETSKWVAGLTDDAMAEAEHAARMQSVEMLTSSDQVPPKPPQLGVVQFMDYLFDCFQQYEFEFNRSSPAPEMMVSIERPTTVVETLRSSLRANETRHVFRGRLSTRFWTLMLRGHEMELEGFILPIDQLISFASDPAHFTQFLTMRGEPTADGDITWLVDDVEITWDKIRSFGKQLFASLLHVAKAESAEGVVFTFHHAEPEPAAGTAGGAQPAANYSFYDHNPAMDDMGYGGSAGAPKAAPPAAAAQANPQRQVTEESVAATQPRMAKPAANPAATPAAAPSGAGQIDAAIAALQKAFDTELEALSAAGQAAFAKQDMATVEQIFQRTNKIKQLRDQVAQQVTAWKQFLNG